MINVYYKLMIYAYRQGLSQGCYIISAWYIFCGIYKQVREYS